MSAATTLHENTSGDEPVQPYRTTSTRSATHHPPDLSFPYLTTSTSHAVQTKEYRTETREGYIAGNATDTSNYARHLTPPGSPLSRPNTISPSVSDVVLHDLESGDLKGKKLVTWKEGDVENPRNWSNAYRWCECSPANSHLPHQTCIAWRLVGQGLVADCSHHGRRVNRGHPSRLLVCRRHGRLQRPRGAFRRVGRSHRVDCVAHGLRVRVSNAVQRTSHHSPRTAQPYLIPTRPSFLRPPTSLVACQMCV